MTSSCRRHPAATVYQGHCAACLIEGALLQAPPAAPARRFTIQVPLGQGDRTSVFLVRGESPWRGLLRLKTWQAPAPASFVEDFERLRRALDDSGPPEILRLLSAWLDDEGRPSVLGEFRQGLPLLEAVRSGRLTAGEAIDLIQPLREALATAHSAGLAHGSLSAGNIFLVPGSSATFLTDFGLSPLLDGSPRNPEALRASDLAGFTSFTAELQAAL